MTCNWVPPPATQYTHIFFFNSLIQSNSVSVTNTCVAYILFWMPTAALLHTHTHTQHFRFTFRHSLRLSLPFLNVFRNVLFLSFLPCPQFPSNVDRLTLSTVYRAAPYHNLAPVFVEGCSSPGHPSVPPFLSLPVCLVQYLPEFCFWLPVVCGLPICHFYCEEQVNCPSNKLCICIQVCVSYLNGDSMMWPNFGSSRPSIYNGSTITVSPLSTCEHYFVHPCYALTLMVQDSQLKCIETYENFLLIYSCQLYNCLIQPCLGSIRSGSKYHIIITGFCL